MKKILLKRGSTYPERNGIGMVLSRGVWNDQPADHEDAAPHRVFISAAEERAEWNQMALTFGHKNEQAQKAFDSCKAGLAQKREVSVDQLPKMTSWFELIEHDEGRM